MSNEDLAQKLGVMPEWDLSDLYSGRDSAELKKRSCLVRKGSKCFCKRL